MKKKKESLNYFLKNGFPNRKLENWKFSDIGKVIKNNLGELSFYNDYNNVNEIDKTIYIKDFEHNKIVIINGKIEKIDFEYEEDNKIKVTHVEKYGDKKNNSNSLLILNNIFSDRPHKITIKKKLCS